MRRLDVAAAIAAVALSVAPAAQAAEQSSVSFVTCPLFRNTVSGCWLVERNGVTYYIGRYGRTSPPQLLHRVLVEGTVSAESHSCGGVVISPIHLSVLPELDYNCNTVLPDNGDDPSEPGLYDLPAPVQMIVGVAQPLPTGPFSSKTFTALFSFGSTFADVGTQALIENAANYAIVGRASKVKVAGHSAQSRLDNGELMVEPADMAERRARQVARDLAALGVDTSRIDVSWVAAPAAADGVHDSNHRSVDIELVIAPAPRSPSE